MIIREIRHFHLFAGLGGGARGFNRGEARVGNLQASFRCIGGVDVDAAAVRDFERLAGVPGTCLDMFDREQFKSFHGHEPPKDWRESGPDDIRKAANNERPHIVFLSAPCKGFSGLLSEKKSTSAKYQALNRLTLRGVWLMLEAWSDDPPELIVFENVPRIATRGRHLLDQITGLLRNYGYAVAETTHDCGELGGLAQTRKRFLLVARHVAKVPPFLYEPMRRPLRAVGDILGRMPMPSDPVAGPMHRLPELQWRTWVRLAFVEAGSDWRSLNRLTVEDGVLRDYGIVPEVAYHAGTFGVTEWGHSSCTVTGRAGVTTGRYAIADPRFPGRGEYGQYGVRSWDETSGAVSAQSMPGGGRYSVADPRPVGPIFGKYAVVPWDKNSGTILSGSTTGQGAFAVADPRCASGFKNSYRVIPFDEPAGTVVGQHSPSNGALVVADPRPAAWRDGREHFASGGHYGVVPWTDPMGAVVAHAKQDRGPFSVADPRVPAPREQCAVVIRSMDGTWHRPFTTLELAALQGLMDPEEHLELDGLSHSAWRERIGNAVPPPAAEAIAGVMGTTLLLAWNGETFAMGSTPIWVRPVAVALMAAQEEPTC